ncbi:transmembrane protein, putative [Bodo saltans]|uniref:Transmembrane protein, putative n=1 Tax=Bodo saltans TaxID=75058 RepID=A0A0S4JL66_BODSA|nr:transmembrane protein, putative [Bodo saltans]|eukprot:CUG90859.1 transmembrane protein, putative [Bodo saltans]
MSSHLSCYPCYKRILCDFIFRRTFLAFFSSRFVETKYSFSKSPLLSPLRQIATVPSGEFSFIRCFIFFLYFSFWMTQSQLGKYLCVRKKLTLYSFHLCCCCCFFSGFVCLFVALLERPLSLQFSCSLKWARAKSLQPETNHYD